LELNLKWFRFMWPCTPVAC